jgi:hypothetical protein
MTMLNGAHERAESLFARRQRQQTEGQQAWSEYQAQKRAVIENAQLLRMLRLARETRKQERVVQSLKSIRRVGVRASSTAHTANSTECNGSGASGQLKAHQRPGYR